MHFFATRGTIVFYWRHAGWFTCAALLALSLPRAKSGADPATFQGTDGPAAPVHLTAEQDHQHIMDLLHITSLRRGADGDPKSPNAANYDESKAGSDIK